jgi:hypothetical protein
VTKYCEKSVETERLLDLKRRRKSVKIFHRKQAHFERDYELLHATIMIFESGPRTKANPWGVYFSKEKEE